MSKEKKGSSLKKGFGIMRESAKKLFVKTKGLGIRLDNYRKSKATELFVSGTRLYKLGEHDAALSDLKKALMINPGRHDKLRKERIAFTIATVYSSIDEHEMELHYYSVSVSHNPRFYEGWFSKGMKYFSLAKRHAKEKVEIKAGILKRITDREGLLKEALHCFKKAISSGPLNPQAHYYAGLMQESLNEPKHALAFFDRALELKPDFPNPERSVLFSKVMAEQQKPNDSCHHCHALLYKEDAFCPKCGKELKQ